MDIGRSILSNRLPRHRLDAGQIIHLIERNGCLKMLIISHSVLDLIGSFGTMGVGPAFAIAAAMYCRDKEPTKRVVCVEGDSAIGFSGMEIETMLR